MIPILAVAFSLAGSALSFSQQSPDLLRQVIPQPTGKNGYEDYLRAAELVRNDGYRPYELFSTDRAEPSAEEAKDPLTERLRTMRLLQVRREQVQKYGQALDLVRAGNAKAIYDPRVEAPTAETLYPELPYFRRIVRLFTADAYVKFADGNTSAATQSLLDGLVLSYNISGGSVISNLVGVSTSSIILAGFEERLGNLSIPDCRKVQSLVERVLAAPLPISAGLDVERKSQIDFIAKSLNDPSYIGSAVDAENTPQIIEMYKKLRGATAQEKERWRQDMTVTVDAFIARIRERLKGPEGQWFGVGDDMQVILSQVTDPTPRALLGIMFPVMDQILIASARQRTQLRLLDLHAKVLEFRWVNGRLPSKLTEALDGGSTMDPLSGEPFAYERTADGYRLYSKGTKETGPIELKYRRTLTDGGASPNPAAADSFALTKVPF